MTLWERLSEVTKTFLTIETNLDHQSEKLANLEREFRSLSAEQRANLSELLREINDLKERVVRLETSRDTDRQSVENLLVRFQLEVERAELRLKQLPPSQTEP